MVDENELAKVAYQAYGDSTGFKNFQGDPMPVWDNLGDAIQTAWRAAADAVWNHDPRLDLTIP